MNTVTVPSEPIAVLSDAWRRCVGTGEFVLGLRRDYLDSLALVQQEIGFRHIRGHGIFHDWLGIHRPYDVAGHSGTRYSWTYLDQVVDAYLEAGIRPFLELGFMPEGLASGDQTVFWWKGNVTPPRDYGEWAALVQATLRHLIARYGRDEVMGWPVEVWNEPNLREFWQGADQREYFRLYDVTARAVKEVDAGLAVGGPAISPGAEEWWAPFADAVAAGGLPVDFVSFHAYSTGPEQHVPFGVYQTLRRPQSLLDQFAAPAQLLAGTALEGLPRHVTEFNSSYRPDNAVHDTAYNAAYLAPVLTRGGDLVDSFSYWTFSDAFEEQGVPVSIFHGGFGLLTHRQIRKPTFHLYAFMARMGTDVLARGDDHLVTRDASGRVTVLAWQPVGGTDDPEEPESHELHLSVPLAPPGGAAPATAYLHRSVVNEEEGNAFTAWGRMGRPASPTTRQLDALYEAAEPVRSYASLPVSPDGRVALGLTLGRHEITLLEIDPVVDETPAWLDDSRIVGRGPHGA